MYNLSVKPEKKIVLKLFQFILLRIRFVLAARIFFFLCYVFLTGFSLISLHKLFFFGDSWINFWHLSLLIVFLLPASVIIVLIKKISLKPFVDKVDRHLGLDDRLNTSYEIINQDYNWGQWACCVLNDTSSKLSGLPLKLSSVFPLRYKRGSVTIICFICFLIILRVISQSEICVKWKEYRFERYLAVNTQKIIDYSNAIQTNEQNYQLVNILQKTAFNIKKTARNIVNTGVLPAKENVVNVLRNSSKLIKNITESDLVIPDQLMLNSLQNHLVKFENGLSDYKSEDIFKNGLSGRGTGKKGIGKSKGVIKKETTGKIVLNGDHSSGKIELNRQGNFVTTIADESIAKKIVPENFEGDVSIIKTSKSEGAVYTNEIPHQNKKIKYAEFLSFNGDITLNPVWIDSIPQNRRECVKKYFSVSRKIRSPHNGK